MPDGVMVGEQTPKSGGQGAWSLRTPIGARIAAVFRMLRGSQKPVAREQATLLPRAKGSRPASARS